MSSLNFYDRYDLNQEDVQRGGDGALPDGSKVLVRLAVRESKEGRQTEHPLVTCLSTGIYALDAEFEVIAGSYKGHLIWEYIFLPKPLQTIQMNDGQKRQCQSGGRKLRAIMEAINNIKPDDMSERAKAVRCISWEQLNDARFPVRVGVRTPEAGDQFVNNRIRAIITPDREEFTRLMGGKWEYISDKPLPHLSDVF